MNLNSAKPVLDDLGEIFASHDRFEVVHDELPVCNDCLLHVLFGSFRPMGLWQDVISSEFVLKKKPLSCETSGLIKVLPVKI